MMQPTFRRFHRLPDVVSGAPLSHFIGVVIPIARTNLVSNPSIETATTGYTAVGGSIAQSATKQYHGVYSLAVTPGAGTTDGAYYGTVSLTSGTTYAYSCKVWAPAGYKMKISLATTGGVDLSIRKFVGTGRWQWMYGYYNETSTTTRRFYFTKDSHTSTAVFYIDGVQVEAIGAGETVSTYIDGDQLGLLVGQSPAPYGWNGTAHASTSYRTALTRAGGSVVNIRTAYNFLLTGLFGLGMAVPNNVAIPYTVLDGARWQRTTKLVRTVSLAGRFQGATRGQLDRARSDMRAAVDRDLIPVSQPLVLMIEPHDDCDQVSGDFAQIQCLYAGGLDGNDTSALAEDAAPAFTMYVPFILGGDAGASLAVQQSVTNTACIIKRSPTGAWQALSTGVSAGSPVESIIVARDGKIYAGGGFTAMAGVANTASIAYFDPADSLWHAMGTGAVGGEVRTLIEDASGAIYAGGDFTSMGGVANTAKIAKWSSGAWASVGGGLSGGNVYALAVNASGLIYVGGSFTNAGGIAAADGIASWDGATYAALGTGVSAGTAVFALAYDFAASALYAGGSFAPMGGVANATRVAKWRSGAWTAMSTGANNNVNALKIAPDKRLYLGGDFTVIGGVSANRNAIWNGTGFSTVGANDANGTLQAIGDQNGPAYTIGGTFSTIGGLSLVDGLVFWNGSAFVYPDVDLGGIANVYAIATGPDGSLYVGSNATGTATAAGQTTLTNTTPVSAFPRVVIKGPSSGTSAIYQLINYTTGVAINFNLTIQAGETVTLDFNPQNPSYRSTVQGDITAMILPGSRPALFYLAPGANSISFFASASSVTATAAWQNRYNGLADLVN